MVRRAMDLALAKANLAYGNLDFMFGGDLLNQIIAANFAARHVPVPFLVYLVPVRHLARLWL